MAYAPGTNTGHGHVWERPDGLKARCGGPNICKECSADMPPIDLTEARHNARTFPDARSIAYAQDRIEELETALQEALLQLQYLHEKFPPTGTSETVIAKIRMALAGSSTYDYETVR